ncbi:MAG: tellurite resistance TerB family protein, partial [Desulfobacteraceae bacterium]
MNISDLLGAVVQSGMAPSSSDRLRNALGGGSANPLDGLAGMLGGQPGSRQGDGLTDLLSG